MTSTPERPVVADPTPWSFPIPVRSRLDNGLEIAVHHLPGQHVISATLLLDHSTDVEPAEQEGVTSMVGRTLTEGTRTHAGERFGELLANEGAAMGTAVGTDGIQVMIDVPAPRLEAALGLLADAVRRPALTDDDVRRQVALRRADIAQAKANSAATATTEYRRRIIDPALRASRPVGGEDETVAAITGRAVRDVHASSFGPLRSTLVIGGDFATDPTALIDTVFGDWTGDAGPADHPRTTGGPQTAVIIDRPGAVQADIRLGGWSVDRYDPRWPALRVAAYPMGGSFTSRLNGQLREEKGYTYGVHLVFTPLRSGGYFTVQGSFRTDVVGAALTEAREILRVDERPFTNEELQAAKNFFAGVSPLQYSTADAVVDQTVLQQTMDLPDDYLDQNLTKVLAVTPEQATDAYNSIVDVNELTLVLVGDADALSADVTAAGFEVEVVTND
ncbi:MAG: insulinase family protein [Propionibacteriales bacterium]|nr:insulinase family protein [Propionibacteriales bacterium]